MPSLSRSTSCFGPICMTGQCASRCPKKLASRHWRRCFRAR
jgi:hypothetical protein